jgi:hypothetical protein
MDDDVLAGPFDLGEAVTLTLQVVGKQEIACTKDSRLPSTAMDFRYTAELDHELPPRSINEFRHDMGP